MKKSRREFIWRTGLAGMGIAAGTFPAIAGSNFVLPKRQSMHSSNVVVEENLIGIYGPWAASLNDRNTPLYSFRNAEFKNLTAWKKKAKDQVLNRMGLPNIGPNPKIQINRSYTYDDLLIDEISWQLPYGRPTEAILLRPVKRIGKLPGILAFHDHSGDKFFGKEKIVQTGNDRHPLMKQLHEKIYSGRAWANELAKRGYVVLVPDAFTFGSRRVYLENVSEHLRRGFDDWDYSKPENIIAYNQWAGQHEHIMAKCLFSAGTTWPGVFFAEDQVALNLLCNLEDVDKNRIGCGGLSGGGLRSVFMGGLDHRIKCAVDVGFMTTWNDLVLQKAFIHTWMAYVPILPNDLDFPEILSLRMPLPTLVLNNSEDPLFSLKEMQQADRLLTLLYQKADAEEKYKCSFYPGLHKFDSNMQEEAFQWFDQWLKQ